jgi:hypothetical protein
MSSGTLDGDGSQRRPRVVAAAANDHRACFDYGSAPSPTVTADGFGRRWGGPAHPGVPAQGRPGAVLVIAAGLAVPAVHRHQGHRPVRRVRAQPVPAEDRRRGEPAKATAKLPLLAEVGCRGAPGRTRRAGRAQHLPEESSRPSTDGRRSPSPGASATATTTVAPWSGGAGSSSRSRPMRSHPS